MRYLLILIIFFALNINGSAQEWRTVATRDTTYFRGSKGPTFQSDILYNEDHATDSGKLKVLYIDSSTHIGSDTIYYFYKTLRDTDNMQCIDTLGASWMGQKLVSSIDGFDYYFNKFNDTIKIKRHTAIGDTWDLAQNTSGITFRGTVNNKGIINIEGITDSFQTLTIQAFQNNAPVSNHYNGKKLEWAKYHGWLNTLDLYRFPNNIDESAFTGALTDTGQLTRLDHFAQMDVNYIDLAWKYAPGNEFIYRYRQSMDIEIWYDSIITSTLLDTNTIIVYCLTNYVDYHWVQNSGPPHYVITGSNYYRTDTITKSNVPMLVKDNYMPEVPPPTLFLFDNGYFADTFCDGRPIIKHFTVGIASGWLDSQPCVHFVNGISGAGESSQIFLYGFGSISQHQAMGLAPTYWDNMYQKRYFTYIKTPSCEWGTKINVRALNVENPIEEERSFVAYPNPAKAYVTIQSSIADNNGIITLMDITGRIFLQKNGIAHSNILHTGNLSKGIYLIRITANGTSQVRKIIIE